MIGDCQGMGEYQDVGECVQVWVSVIMWSY